MTRQRRGATLERGRPGPQRWHGAHATDTWCTAALEGTTMEQQHAHGDTVYRTALIERLRDLHLAGTALPDVGETPFTLTVFYRFRRYIIAEGYGHVEEH